MKIIFRCDGANLPEVGTGHVVRMVSLAKNLIRNKFCRNSDINFVTRGLGEYAVGMNMIVDAGFVKINTKDSDLVWNSLSEAKMLVDLNADLLIIDRLSTELSWMREVTSKNTKIIVFDDNGPGAEFATIVINGILHSKKYWPHYYQGYEYLYLGVPSEINISPIQSQISKIVATFGGHDERDLVDFFLNSIFDVNNKNRISVDILVREVAEGTLLRWNSKIHELLRIGWKEIRVIRNAPDFYQRLSTADLVLTAGGITVFEAISLGRPVIGLPQYSHQMETLVKLANIGAIVLGTKSMDLDSSYLGESINHISRSALIREKMTSIGMELIDGRGANRIIHILENKFLKFIV